MRNELPSERSPRTSRFPVEQQNAAVEQEIRRKVRVAYQGKAAEEWLRACLKCFTAEDRKRLLQR